MRTTVKKLAAVVGLTAMLALSGCASADEASSAHPVTDPAVGIAIDGTGKAVAPTEDAVVVEVFSDFLCPWCERFELEHGGDLLALADDDRFDVRWRPVAWLDRNAGGTEYSTRTAMLLVHVAQESPEHFWDTVAAIMSVRESGPTLTHAELADVVAAVGVEGDLVAVQSDDDLRDTVLAFSNEASSLEVRHVPWANIDGEQWDWSAEDAGSLLDAAHATLG
ncbi:DSBA oxidoreductase [Xylanimonas cellulosilytica DSM 15894]|uniref:DSBA oxidoreductase n=1 Tax=Xylanimonas cellulosilytica (strain DSM 15894 / JCM 12276 / CECT 5975 / KCTC 9989 / LMG 20990 / NBRC 107835 / XIL07) TaxID=446471 RepID=D1BZM0_XYLCX|nr:thioredoxin domain-containing protein [Xylanimonas cellulosilytica]ACZ30174.1 DSBA oxidoreductase [Xylanimonas cellulosilytica DSM 15894]